MTNEQIYKKVVGHKPNKKFGIKGSFSWDDINKLMNETIENYIISNGIKLYSQEEIDMVYDKGFEDGCIYLANK